jgi:hypothetical protein
VFVLSVFTISINLTPRSISSQPVEFPTLFPTNYPAPRQTYEVGVELTNNAMDLEEPDFSGFFPPVTETPYLMTPVGVQAGSGFLSDDFLQLPGYIISNVWFRVREDVNISVYAGGKRDSTRGIVIVVYYFLGNSETFQMEFSTPLDTGGVKIVDAYNDRLMLTSTTGVTFYFDVPSATFVSSLEEVVSTATIKPSASPKPSKTPNYTDDAPNNPWDVLNNSSVDMDLSYKLESNTDIDWFRFHTDYPGQITVSLSNLSANYDLYVYSATDKNLQLNSTNVDLADETVVIDNALPNDYYVCVVGVNGAFDLDHPYTLRKRPPQL